MKKRFIGILISAILVASVFTLSGCGSSSSGDTIKIGTLGPYSGDTAMYGEAAKKGIQLAVDQVNNDGGINGKQVELVSYDTKGDTTEAVSAYNRLVNEDEVAAIAGPVLSGEALAVKDAAKEDNIPMVTPTATAAEVTQDAPNSFRVCFLDEYQGNAAAKYAASADGLNAKTAAMIVSKGNSYSEGLAAAFKTTFEAQGGTVVDTENYADSDTDFSAQLTKVKDSGAEVVYIPDYYNTAGPMLQKAKEMGLTAKFMGGDGWDSIQKDYADAADGDYFTNHYAADNQAEVVQSFLSAYKNAYNETPNSFAALGYDAAMTVMDAIKNADSTDHQKIIDALKDINVNGVTGSFTFDENGNPKGKEISIIQVNGGELKYVTSENGDKADNEVIQ